MSANTPKATRTVHVRNDENGKPVSASRSNSGNAIDVNKTIEDAMKLHTTGGKTTCTLAVWFINSLEFSYVGIEALDNSAGADRTEKFNALLSQHSETFKTAVERRGIIDNEVKELSNKPGKGVQVHDLKVEKAEIDGKLKSARNILGTAIRVARLCRKNGARSAEMVGKLNQLRVVDKDGKAETDSLNEWLKSATKAFKATPDPVAPTSTGTTAQSAANEPASLVGKALRSATNAVDMLAATKDKDGKPVAPDAATMAEVDTLVAHLMQLIGPKALEQKIEALKIKLRRDANAKPDAKPEAAKA